MIYEIQPTIVATQLFAAGDYNSLMSQTRKNAVRIQVPVEARCDGAGSQPAG